MDQRRADFDRFVADSTDTLLRTAYLIVWDLGEAEDLVQETLLDVARRWPRVRRMERPLAYARRILVNRALRGASRRARRRHELVAETPPERSPRRAARPPRRSTCPPAGRGPRARAVAAAAARSARARVARPARPSASREPATPNEAIWFSTALCAERVWPSPSSS